MTKILIEFAINKLFSRGNSLTKNTKLINESWTFWLFVFIYFALVICQHRQSPLENHVCTFEKINVYRTVFQLMFDDHSTALLKLKDPTPHILIIVQHNMT